MKVGCILRAREGAGTSRPLRSYLGGANLADRALNFLTAFREIKVFALAVTLTNLGGVAYGIMFYWAQLNETPWYLIPLVPDSPTGPFLMVLVFALWWFRGHRRSPTLELLAFVSLLKYGVWTVLVFWLYRADFFAPDRAALTQTLLALHIAEAVEAGVLLKGMRLPRAPFAALAALWLALGDFSDYVLGTHPRLPQGIDPALGTQVVPSMTVALTIICYLAAILWCRHLAGSRRAEGGKDEHVAPSAPPPGPP